MPTVQKLKQDVPRGAQCLVQLETTWEHSEPRQLVGVRVQIAKLLFQR